MEEFAASYALESLEPDERSEFHQHIAACSVCRELTSEFAVTADVLPDTLEPASDAPLLKERLLAAVAADTTAPVNSPTDGLAQPERPSWLSSIFGRRYQAAYAAAAAVIIVALLTWNIALQFGGGDTDDAPQFVSGAYLYDLQGTEAAPGASGSVYRATESLGYLVLDDLPAPPSTHVFQVWHIRGEVPHPGNTFARGQSNRVIVAVTGDVANSDTLGITIEPEGGSEAPTSPVLLLRQS